MKNIKLRIYGGERGRKKGGREKGREGEREESLDLNPRYLIAESKPC